MPVKSSVITGETNMEKRIEKLEKEVNSLRDEITSLKNEIKKTMNGVIDLVDQKSIRDNAEESVKQS